MKKNAFCPLGRKNLVVKSLVARTDKLDSVGIPPSFPSIVLAEYLTACSDSRGGPRLRGGALLLDPSEATPHALTGGESIPDNQSAKVDWFACSFPGPDSQTPLMFLAVLGRLFSRKLTGVEGRGLFGFEKSIKLETQVGSNKFAIGVLAYGGEHQRGRWMFQITGVGCSVVPDWHRFSKFFRRIGARITRLDLAVDYLDGAYTVDDAVAMYQSGAFTTNGRPPSSHVAGDWLNKVMGRTLYIGKSTNGKMLRVYEKGIQLGELNSPWVRFEVQLGNRDRVIPFDAMTRRDAFLAGCYPALQTMLGCASEAISTSRKEGALLVSHLMFHLKRSYGKLLSVVSSVFTPDSSDLIDCLTVIGTPRRMTPAVESPGITFEQILRDMDAVTA